MEYLVELLKSGASKLGMQLSDEAVQKFYTYLTQLKKWNEKFNLTAITKDEEIIIKHFVDSLACLLVIPETLSLENSTLLDIGSGAGFPGLPLKIYQPHLKLTLLEASHKKGGFLKSLVSYLKLRDVEILIGRAEEYGQKNQWRGKYDLVTGRAVAELPVLVEYALPFLVSRQRRPPTNFGGSAGRPWRTSPSAGGGIFIAQRGAEITEELKEAKMAIELLGGTIKETKEYELEVGTDKIKRNLVVIEKISDTPVKYPRRVGIPQKRPIK